MGWPGMVLGMETDDMPQGKGESISAGIGAGCALLVGIVVVVPMLLAVLDSFLALDIWPWTECVWDYSGYFDYPVKRCTSSVSVFPDWLRDWLIKYG